MSSEEYLNNISLEEIEEEGNSYGNIYCSNCSYCTEEMQIRDAVFKINMQGGYYMFDGEGGSISHCPACQENRLEIQE